MKQLPIGLQEFKDAILTNQFIIDKTERINDLTKFGSGQYYFLSRPRRFGKSFLLSQIRSLFLGEKELFKDMWIYDKWNWQDTFPVLHVSFDSMNHNGTISAKEHFLDKGLVYFDGISKTVREFILDNGGNVNLSADFGNMTAFIHKITGKKTVVLIDEYDNPVMKNIANASKFEKIRDDLQTLYSAVKSNGPSIRFFFLTGLARVMKMSIFSTMNNLRDISAIPAYYDIVGYSNEDMEKNFGEIFKQNRVDTKKVQSTYNGFTFSNNLTDKGVYNPWI